MHAGRYTEETRSVKERGKRWGENEGRKVLMRERGEKRERERRNMGVRIEQPVSIARGFTLSSAFLSSPPARILLFLLRLLPHLLSCCSSSVCGSPQIIRINIITSSGAASLFLSPRSTHHDVTHDRFRAPVKPRRLLLLLLLRRLLLLSRFFRPWIPSTWPPRPPSLTQLVLKRLSEVLAECLRNNWWMPYVCTI